MSNGIAINLKHKFAFNEDSVLIHSGRSCRIILQGDVDDGENILMSALTNLMAGSYLLQTSKLSFLTLTKLASLLIMVTPILFFIAFVYEPADYLIERPMTFWAVIVLVAGLALHTLPNIGWLNKNSN